MAHLIENMFYFGEKPWHQLGVELKNPATAEGAIREGGLDWLVKKSPIYLNNGQEVKESKAIVRCTDDKILGVVGNRYEALQNIESFGFFDSIVEEGAAIYHTAGSLNEGRRIWLLAKLPDYIRVKGNDIVDKYLLLSNSHDGSSTVQIKFSPIRVICQNTLSAALKSGDTFNVRHTKSVADRIKNVKDLIGITTKEFQETEMAYRMLAHKPMNGRLLDNYLKVLFPDNLKAENKARTENTRNNIINLFETHPANNLPETKDTLWSAYNAVTHYVDHERGSDKNRLNSAWFGSGAVIKNQAFAEALKLAS